MKKKWIGPLGAMAFAVALTASGFSWEADFDPATFNPGIGELVNFAVCEPCLEGGVFQYQWDFDGDGVAEMETGESLVTFGFASPGFYEVELTVVDAAGRASARREGILVGDLPAHGVRDVLEQEDGTFFVLITIISSDSGSSLGIEERIPQGWQVEVVDAAGAITNTNAEARTLEVIWASAFDSGDELSFSYRLYRGYGTGVPALYGTLSGYTSEGRFEGEIAGELRIPE